MAKVGAPPKYSSAKNMQAKIDEYFEITKGEIAVDANGDPIYTKYGEPCYKTPHRPPTITGLALHLGFASRQSLIEYAQKEAFGDTITRAKARIEAYAEERLYDREGQRGAEFNLRCNFGWKSEKNEDEPQEMRVRIIDDI